MNKKQLLSVIILLVASLCFGRSKPTKGFTAFLLGEPDSGTAYTNQLPHGESAVYSMVTGPKGNVFCGTRVVSGQSAWLLRYNTKEERVANTSLFPIHAVLPGEKCITALARGKTRYIYGATSNLQDIDYKDEADVKAMGYAGGHLFRFKAKAKKIKIQNLGIPFKGEGIATLTADAKNGILYGITVPSQILFSIKEKSGKVTEIGRLDPVENWRHLYIGKSTKALIVDAQCQLWGSTKGKLFKYDPGTNKLTVLETSLPTEGSGADYDCIATLIRTTSGRLFGGTFLDGKLFELFPESESKFFLKVTDAQITFHRDSDGKVNRITLHQGGQDMPGKRINQEDVDKIQLAEYEGYYYSDELGTTYKMKVIDGKLIAQHRRHDDITLTLNEKDRFSGSMWFFRNVLFTRDNDKITGFKLTGGRVRNLKFIKQR